VFGGIHHPETHRHVGLRKSEVQHKLNRTVFQQCLDGGGFDAEFAGAGFGRSGVDVSAEHDLHLLKAMGGSEVGGTDVACADDAYS
jgi:hypothetical protein